VRIKIEGFDLPGRTCGPGPDLPFGHANVHVAVQGRKGPQDLFGLVPGDRHDVTWELDAMPAATGPELFGPQIQGAPGKRFIYLTWGDVDGHGTFTMFRRAKLWLDAVPRLVLGEALESGLLVGRVGLSDERGGPLCASVRPPRITWSAASAAASAAAD
jgi:hypothetical protein